MKYLKTTSRRQEIKLLITAFQSLVYVLSLIYIYQIYGYPANKYLGYNPIQFGSDYLLMASGSYLFAFYLFGKQYKKPSDYFLMLYGLAVIIPNMLLVDVWHGGERFIIFRLFLHVIPFLIVMIASNFNLRLERLRLINETTLDVLILLVSVAIIFVLLNGKPATASLSLENSYIRRLEARNTYESGTILAYLSSMIMNGTIPLCVFVGIYKGRIIFMIAAIVLYMMDFYIYGIKAPLLYMTLAGVLAFSLSNHNPISRFYDWLRISIVSSFGFAWIEILFFNYSYVEDYLIRRIYYVSANISGAYSQLIHGDSFSWMTGVLNPSKEPLTFYVGEHFLGAPGANANTNTFLYFFAQHGIPGYVFITIFVSMIFLIFDALRFQSGVFIFLAMMFSILLLEQSATTAFISSGIGILLFSYFLSGKSEYLETLKI